jgi:hypothetical protein
VSLIVRHADPHELDEHKGFVEEGQDPDGSRWIRMRR